MMYYIIVFMK
jgi:hypothetical protein